MLKVWGLVFREGGGETGNQATQLTATHFQGKQQDQGPL